jgi:outer membrane autotransporter protein
MSQNKSIITPYLMAGVGGENVGVDGTYLGFSYSEDETVFAGQVGAGLASAVSENVSIDTEYRYFRAKNPEFDGVEAEISGHRLQVGVRYTFRANSEEL